MYPILERSFNFVFMHQGGGIYTFNDVDGESVTIWSIMKDSLLYDAGKILSPPVSVSLLWGKLVILN